MFTVVYTMSAGLTMASNHRPILQLTCISHLLTIVMIIHGDLSLHQLICVNVCMNEQVFSEQHMHTEQDNFSVILCITVDPAAVALP